MAINIYDLMSTPSNKLMQFDGAIYDSCSGFLRRYVELLVMCRVILLYLRGSYWLLCQLNDKEVSV